MKLPPHHPLPHLSEGRVCQPIYETIARHFKGVLGFKLFCIPLIFSIFTTKNSRVAMPTKQTESAPSFLQVYMQVRRDRMKHSFLRQISACVDWRGIRTLLNKKHTKTQNATDNPAYDALMMFKILLLQTWYDLSDYEVEERINDSLLFSEFLLLDMGLPAPDHSTICRFHAEPTRLGIMDKLLHELNKLFKKHGISRIDQGAIVDASIVDCPS